ncbi:hypothetical protein JCM21714_4713 [Gracilibacillus boraciitolerans JCM 21714]|uniref:Transposase DDE domain-containing protein n=2 Tax=Gracilibacillus boraciitolerans TaxID=307521 RepID=W4VR12_9BACI|nr:hypothetical protein JCM21714_4713 [Gracilibacillus boraciitolerans JCM 21714]
MNHADHLNPDPALTTILNKSELASQPTMSRVNQHMDKDTLKQFQEVNRTLIDRYHEWEAPEILVLAIDSSNSAIYGDPYGSAYIAFHPNFHCDNIGRQPRGYRAILCQQ